jgi:UPF0755 protein
MLRFLLILSLLLAGGAAVAWYDYDRFVTTPVVLEGSDQTFTIERGWSARRVSKELVAKGLIDKPHWFDVYTRISGKAAAIKSGEYVLDNALTVPELVDVFIAGQTRQYSHSIIEGDNWRQMLVRLAVTETLEQTLNDVDENALMTAIGFPDLHPEGQFFSDTYRYPKNTSDTEYLKRAKRRLDQVLAEEWESRDPNLPLNDPYQALILASIVEKETAVAAERPLIAGVFLSRLTKRMRLQTDPTVIYGMGERYDGNIRRSDLTTDTPYNTYTRAGLPPTPIAMVGREAIHAVLHPEATTSLYFVARGNGTHQFSETIEQHNAAVRKYQLKR